MLSEDGAGLRIAGSLWSVAPDRQEELLARATGGGLDAIHWDVADGLIGFSGGFSPQRAESLASTVALRSEAHLMVSDPLKHVDLWTDLCDIVVVHYEANGWQRALERIEQRGSTPALAVSPSAPTSVLRTLTSHMLVMSVSPGTAGSGFQEEAYERASIAARVQGRQVVGWDGSVDLAQAHRAHTHGVTWLVSGTALFAHGTPEEWLLRARATVDRSPRRDNR